MYKKVLIICPYFVNKNHVASRRIEAYARYFARYYNVLVLTEGRDDGDDIVYFDDGCCSEVVYLSNAGFVHNLATYTGLEGRLRKKIKTAFRLIFSYFGLSIYRKWRKKVELYLEKYGESIDPFLIISSCGPVDSLLAPYEFLKKNKDVDWVVDMRDEYACHPSAPKHLKSRFLNIEKKCSNRADVVVSVSDPLVESFKFTMPCAKKFVEVRNGVDHDLEIPAYKKSKQLKIGCFGSLYPGFDYFLSCFSKFARANPDVVLYVATESSFKIPDSLAKIVKKIQFLPYKEAVSLMADMDCNLLVLPKDGRKGVFSGRIFDYISAKRPVFLVSPIDNVAAQFVLDNNVGYLCDPSSEAEILEALSSLYEDWRSSSLPLPPDDLIASVNREAQVDKLLSLFVNKIR